MKWLTQPDYVTQMESIAANYTATEAAVVDQLIAEADFLTLLEDSTAALATDLVAKIRQGEKGKSGMAGIMQHYDLGTDEGLVLMCVAEALLRIPDPATAKQLIEDKLTSANWQQHLGKSESSFVNLSTWGLALTGKILQSNPEQGWFSSVWRKMVKKSSEGVIRQAVNHAVKLISEEFVLGRNISEAFKRGRALSEQGYSFSFDMLGEAAFTLPDAERYFAAYSQAIDDLAKHINPDKTIFQRAGISVKLSALYPRYEFLHQADAIDALADKLLQLAIKAKDLGIALTVDAEEADRLDMSLQIFKRVYLDAQLGDWAGLGLAVQAYQKRGVAVIEWLIALAQQGGKRVQVRLVKGAYWDTEIKQAQMHGWQDYPVFTRKVNTDLSYLVCAKRLLHAQEFVYPKFATHNAYSVAAILNYASKKQLPEYFEFQNLQGMGKALHAEILQRGLHCRVYAPVGSYRELLPYLVRRLLENGANSSFVNQIVDDNVPLASLVRSPLQILTDCDMPRNPAIVLPRDIFPDRLNSAGVNLSCFPELQSLMSEVATANSEIDKRATQQGTMAVTNPANHTDRLGAWVPASKEDVAQRVATAQQQFSSWRQQTVAARAAIMDNMAEQLQAQLPQLVALLTREAGKVVNDAIGEVREAIDFCRYYAQQARVAFEPLKLPGYTGESNFLTLEPRGVVACISPWNFPLAIFLGQIVAALVTGNTVIAKPAEQTTLIANYVLQLFEQAGLPAGVLQLLPGTGQEVGAALIAAPEIAAVMFTGSTATAKLIQQSLANKPGPIVPFIAETGGMNAMLADSTCLPEQLVADVIESAFGSAGQRCSALRILLLQDEIADKVIAMLQGAMSLLRVGDPQFLETDIGPVIDAVALERLEQHLTRMHADASLLAQAPLPENLNGHFIAPVAFELTSLSQLEDEVFGPVLHVMRYDKKQLDEVIDAVNGFGYGLTFGIHSRINATVEYVQQRMAVGNVYVNRNTVGAVVGVQPFGGCGLSGTGPKAGGPHYLQRLCTEKTITTDTTAAGGNASLYADDESV